MDRAHKEAMLKAKKAALDRAVKQKEFGERYIKSSTQSRVAPEGGAVSAADGGSFQPSLRWQ